MKFLLAAAASLLLFLTPVVSFGEDQKDAKALDGTWITESAELGGQKFPDELTKSIKLVLKGDKYTVTVGQNPDHGTCKIDASKKPKTMDITGTEGPNKGKTFLAIYEVDKDSLKICYDLAGKERPTEFKTKPETKLFLATYKREKP